MRADVLISGALASTAGTGRFIRKATRPDTVWAFILKQSTYQGNPMHNASTQAAGTGGARIEDAIGITELHDGGTCGDSHSVSQMRAHE
jgi:hypothetical protein